MRTNDSPDAPHLQEARCCPWRVVGTCVAALLKNGWSGGGWDALLGGIALVGTILLFAYLPWPRNTITYAAGGGTVTSTMNRFQHDEAVAWTLAVLLPVAHEAHRRTRRRETDPHLRTSVQSSSDSCLLSVDYGLTS